MSTKHTDCITQQDAASIVWTPAPLIHHKYALNTVTVDVINMVESEVNVGMTDLSANLVSFHSQLHSANMRRSRGIYWSDTSAGRQWADLIWFYIGSGCCLRAFSTLAKETATKLQLGVEMGTVPFLFRKEIYINSHQVIKPLIAFIVKADEVFSAVRLVTWKNWITQFQLPFKSILWTWATSHLNSCNPWHDV